jgi:hypothetical protein
VDLGAFFFGMAPTAEPHQTVLVSIKKKTNGAGKGSASTI